MKKKGLIMILTIIIFTLSACKLSDNFEQNKTTMKNKEESEIIKYENLTNDFSKVNMNEINILKTHNEQFILFIGYKECPYCREFVPKLHEFMKNNNVKIYYLDTKNISEKEIDLFDTFSENINLEYVPALYKINGDIFEDLDIDSQKTSQSDLKMRIL